MMNMKKWKMIEQMSLSMIILKGVAVAYVIGMLFHYSYMHYHLVPIGAEMIE